MADADLALIERQAELVPIAERLRGEVARVAGFTSVGFTQCWLRRRRLSSAP